ncbi:hypothetical protein [Zavarzinia sp.]|uniref:hypothetical protein n=1 Tax=Zavarzinia sp. TaxID=2027920 RepID=UPI003569C00C
MDPAGILSPEIVKAYGSAGVAGILALALLLVVVIVVAAALRLSKQQTGQVRMLQDHHTAEMALWQRALDQFQSGQIRIADALTTQSDAITSLTASVGTEALNQIRLGAGTQILDVSRKLEKFADSLDRIETALVRYDARIQTLEEAG